MDQIESQIPATEEQADDLLQSIEEPQGEVQNTQDQQAQQQAIEEFKFMHGGREVKGTRENILKWASQGYDAPNRIGQLNKEIESFRQKENQFKEWESKYGEVDKYARENPQWFAHIMAEYNRQIQQGQGNVDPGVLNMINDLKSQVQGLNEYKNSIVMKQEDEQYMKQFEGIKNKYKTVDFATPDESGKSLEYKVLEFAKDNGIKNFEVAFKAFYHDEIVKQAEEAGKTKAISEKQSRTKLGILGTSQTPTKKISDNVKGKSWNDLANEAISELG